LQPWTQQWLLANRAHANTYRNTYRNTMTPFLEIVTRCYKRPTMLADNQAALARQTDGDWTQTLLVDEVGIGVEAANAVLASVEPVGRYVWVLDDDDLCICDTLVSDLKAIVAQHEPDLIFVRFDHRWLGLLPPAYLWRTMPICGGIGGSGVIARADLWMRCRERWASGRYESDYDYVLQAYNRASAVYWHDVIAGRVQRISRGAVE
jgi:hypothetical protein